jgi:hypothetical protein
LLLGGAHPPATSPWRTFGPSAESKVYWFFGQHSAAGVWTPDAGVGHIFDLYTSGTMSYVRFDDTGKDRDFDDYMLEIAVLNLFIVDLDERQRDANAGIARTATRLAQRPR